MDKQKKKGIGIIGWILLFIVFIAAGYFAKMQMPNVGHNVVIDTKTLKSELIKINELATYQKEYRETITKEKDGFLSKRYYATFDGVIRAGVNMDSVDCEVKLDEDTGATVVEVTMPDAVILDHTDSNWQVVYEDGYQSKDIGEERNSVIKEKRKEVEKTFVEDGGLKMAKEKAEKVIKGFIEASYGDDIVVEFIGEE